MRIDLAGWSSRGLRSPDVDIDLTGDDGAPAKVALIQMPNGTGKTTTLELIKATLSNTAGTWNPDKVRSFRRRLDNRPEGQFVVRLLINGRPLTFELTLDFENGATRYRTTNLGSGGIASGWTPPPDVHRFLSPEFLRLFIFDGEFADELFDPTRAEADRAIDALCQLYLLKDVSDFAEGEWDRKSKAGGPKTDAGLMRYQGEQTALLKRENELRRMETAAVREVERLSKLITDLDAKITERLSSMKSTQAEHASALQSLNDARRDVMVAAGGAMSAIRMPLAIHREFGNRLIALKENLDHLRLPENTSAQFFEELVHEDECICGREMTAGARAEITARAKRYLDADESGTINALKSDIDKFTAHDGEEPLDKRLTDQLRALGTARRAEHQADQLVRTLKQKLIDAGDEQLKAWQSELDESQGKYAEFHGVLSRVRGDGLPDEDPIWSLKQLEKKKSEVSAKIAGITQTVTLRKQTDLLKTILNRAAELARAEIKQDLVAEANQRLRGILINDPIEIAQIDRSLRLADQEGASVGQTLSVGYTFLMSVLNRGNNNFPLVVDSPANPIDADVRHNIGTLIPELCTQFVGFTINTERQGFVPALEQTAASIKYLTLFRKTEGTKRLMGGLPRQGVTETETAVLIEEREYFMNFGLGSEEEA
jgi:DNA sulfur modification protein DndD